MRPKGKYELIKYEIVKDKKKEIEIDGEKITVYRIRALRDIVDENGLLVKKGAFGGYVQSQNNLSQHGTCWIGGSAVVCQGAQVFGNAHVYGKALVCGDAMVYDKAKVFDEAQIFDKTQVLGSAQVYDRAQASDKAFISGNVFGDAKVYGEAQIHDKARVYDNAKVYDHAQVFGSAQIYDRARIYGNAQVCGESEVADSAQAYENAKICDSTLYEYTQVYGDAEVADYSFLRWGYIENTEQAKRQEIRQVFEDILEGLLDEQDAQAVIKIIVDRKTDYFNKKYGDDFVKKVAELSEILQDEKERYVARSDLQSRVDDVISTISDSNAEIY